MADEKVVSLFDLFTEFEEFEIKDDEGRGIKFKMKALNHGEYTALQERMQAVRIAAEKQFNAPEHKERVRAEVAAMTPDKIKDQIIEMEKPAADAVADLAPGEDVAKLDGEARTAKLAEISVQWEKARRDELAENAGGLVDILVERVILSQISNKATAQLLTESISSMVLDIKTGAPLLSPDPQTSNYIGKLMIRTRAALADKWQEFMRKSSERATREVASSGDFLPSGAPVAPSTDSPGATVESSATSQLVS